MANEGGRALDFADIYRDQLVSVWRYVRSRVHDHHDAQDVTSEVFARAWRSWGSYDPSKGEVPPWLLRIAQRTVVDWTRKHIGTKAVDALDLNLVESVQTGPSELPEAILLAKEVLAEVSQALRQLSERERDGIALRFGAGLKIVDVARVLGLSNGATKMMIGRALNKLSAAMARRSQGQAVAEAPLPLDELVEQALMRSRSGMPATELADLVLQLAVLHRPEMPPDLPKQVQLCVDCATGTVNRIRAGLLGNRNQPPTAPGRQSFASVAFMWAPLSPICLACTLPVLVVPLVALGMSLDVAYSLHALSLVTAPLVALVIWRHFQRHRLQLALFVGTTGAALLVAHLVGHIVVADGVPGWSVTADRLGTVLLLAGTVIDAIALNRWVTGQRQRLAVAATDFRLVPA